MNNGFLFSAFFWDGWKDWQKYALLGGVIIVGLIVFALIIVLIAKSVKKVRYRNKTVVGEEQVKDIGKLTLEFANAIFKATNVQTGKGGKTNKNAIQGSFFPQPSAPITLVVNNPVPMQGVGYPMQGVGYPMQGIAYNPMNGVMNNQIGYYDPNVGYAPAPVKVEELGIKKELSKDYGQALNKKGFYAQMIAYVTDGMLKERIFEEIYLPKKYTRQRFFGNKELVNEMLRREKKRLYKLYKSGLSVVDACKSKYDLEREAILSMENNLNYLLGYNADSAAQSDEVDTLNSRMESIALLKKSALEEIHINVKTSTLIRAEESKLREDLKANEKLYKSSKGKEKKAVLRVINGLNNGIYSKDKEADECERVILFKDILIKECDAALSSISQRLNELNSAESKMSEIAEAAPAITEPASAITQYPSIITSGADPNEIGTLEREMAENQRYSLELESRMAFASEAVKRKMSFKRLELSERNKYITKQIEYIRNSAYGHNAPINSSPSEKIIKVQSLRNRLRLTETEGEALAILNKLYDINLSLTNEEKSDQILIAAIEKAIKDGLHAAELNRYTRILQDYKRTRRN